MKIKIYYDNNQTLMPVSTKLKGLMRKAAEATLKYEGVDNPCEISITFTDNEQIRQLNNEFRKIDRATDVLSFPLEEDAESLEDDELLVLGDIVISLERAKEQADEYGHSFWRETAFLCIHSMLHLLGYDHELSEEDDADMRRRQREIIESIGLGIDS